MILLIIPTILFWLIPIFQANFLLTNSGDWLFLLIIGWVWYVGILKQSSQVKFWELVIPFVLGLGMSSYLFSPIYTLLIYIVPFLVLSAVLFKKSVWFLRWKESLAMYVGVFILFILIELVLKGFSSESLFDFKSISTFVLGLILTIFLVANKDRGRSIIW